MTEHEQQAAVIAWARLMTNRYPELHLLYAIPNGARMRWSQAVKMKAEGLLKGIPDLCLPVARQGYHGLYIEMKNGHGKPTPEQLAMIGELNAQNYLAVVCWGADEAIELIEDYLK